MTTARILTVLILSVAAGTAALHADEKLNGYAEYKKDGFLIVDGQRVAADKKTRIDGNRKVRGFQSVPLGYEVEIKGKRLPDGTVLARKIEVHRNRDTDVDRELRRGFDEIESQYLKKGRMVRVDEQGKVVEDLGELLTEGPMVNRVRAIASNLSPPYVDSADFRVYVVVNDEWNAMAAPNYSIFVFSGLLQAMDDDEVAIVLGHELAHATHEHSGKQYNQGTWVQIGAIVAAGVAGETIDDGTARQAAQLGAMLGASAVATGYSRDHEDQADRVGLRYAYEAGFDVTKAPGLWQKFAKKYGDSPVAVNFFFGGHSRSSKRAELLRQEIKYNYRDPNQAPPATP